MSQNINYHKISGCNLDFVEKFMWNKEFSIAIVNQSCMTSQQLQLNATFKVTFNISVPEKVVLAKNFG